MTHEKPTPPNHEIILPDIKGYEDLYEDQEPLHLEFDPSSLAVMTAADMKRIETEVTNQVSAGIEPGAVQEYVDAQLEQLHMDPSTARDGVMAVRFVGIDGKYDIRAIDVNANGDFGVQVLNAEIAMIDTRADVQEVAPSPEEQLVIEQGVETLLSKQLDLTRGIAARFAEDAEYYHRRKHALDLAVSEISSAMEAIRAGRSLSPDLVRHLVGDVVPEARSLMAYDVESAQDEAASARGYHSQMDMAARAGVEGINNDRSDELKEVMERAIGKAVSLVENRRSTQKVSEEMRFLLDQLSRSLEDLSHSTYNEYENIVGQVSRLGQHSKNHDELSRQVPVIFKELEGILNRGQ